MRWFCSRQKQQPARDYNRGVPARGPRHRKREFVSRVWKVSHAIPCGSAVQYLSERVEQQSEFRLVERGNLSSGDLLTQRGQFLVRVNLNAEMIDARRAAAF